MTHPRKPEHLVAITHRQPKSVLNRSGMGGFTLNPYTGCPVGCSYCYVPHMAHKQTEDRAWGSYVEVKNGAAQVLAQQLKRLRQPTRIFMSSATDPYQPAEEQHRITRAMLEVFVRYPEHALHILTKQPLVERDADLLTQLPRVAVGMSFSTLDDHLSSIIEPWAPVTSERLAVIRRLSARGIATYLLWAPAIVPAPMPEKFVAEAIEQIAQSQTRALSLDALNYRARQSAGFERRLAREGHAPATKAQVALLRHEAERRGLQHRLELPEPALPDWATPMLPF